MLRLAVSAAGPTMLDHSLHSKIINTTDTHAKGGCYSRWLTVTFFCAEYWNLLLHPIMFASLFHLPRSIVYGLELHQCASILSSCLHRFACVYLHRSMSKRSFQKSPPLHKLLCDTSFKKEGRRTWLFQPVP